jgi:adenine phosphoribosyltransferase
VNEELKALLEKYIRDIPDFPKEGILFKDITPLLATPAAFVAALDGMADNFNGSRIDAIVGIESRGFIFGAALAARIDAAFIPVRKPGKLPAETDAVSYELEYGTDTVEMHKDALAPGDQVILVDDLIATGGTAAAAIELCRRRGATILGATFLIELTFLRGRDKLEGVPVHSLLQY